LIKFYLAAGNCLSGNRTANIFAQRVAQSELFWGDKSIAKNVFFAATEQEKRVSYTLPFNNYLVLGSWNSFAFPNG
jgi:hypothetical protein